MNIIRKYVQLLDLPISLLSASYWYLVMYDQRKVIRVSVLIYVITTRRQVWDVDECLALSTAFLIDPLSVNANE